MNSPAENAKPPRRLRDHEGAPSGASYWKSHHPGNPGAWSPIPGELDSARKRLADYGWSA